MNDEGRGETTKDRQIVEKKDVDSLEDALGPNDTIFQDEPTAETDAEQLEKGEDKCGT